MIFQVLWNNLSKNGRRLELVVNWFQIDISRSLDQDELAQIHLEMKDFCLRNGWTEQEAEEEYLRHVEQCREPYQPPVGLEAITHSVYDRKSGNTFKNLSLAELSDYYLFG